MNFISALHPLMVHLPIGLLIFLFLMELYHFLRGQLTSRVVSLPIWLGAFVFSSCAVFTGWFLAGDGKKYAEELLFKHRILGFSVLALSALGFVLRLYFKDGCSKKQTKIYRVVLLLSFIFVSACGHFGGSMVYGKDYLWKHLPMFASNSSSPESHSAVEVVKVDFRRDILSIFEKRCFKCHGELKQKGELRLDNASDAFRGGENGPVLVPYHSEMSSLFESISLPEGSDDIMPAKGDPLTKEQIQKIKQWIDTGAIWIN